MTWARFDDGYRTSRKVAPLSDAAFRLDVEGIMWSTSAPVLSDGQVRAHELTQIRSKATRRHAAELVAAGRWHTAGTLCPSPKCPPSGPDGWVIHDFWDQQKTREQILTERAVKAERQRKWMEGRRGGTPRGAADTPVAPPVDAPATPPLAASLAPPSTPPSTPLLTHAPSPPRPAPKGSGEGTSPKQPAARREAAERADDGRAEKPTIAHSPPINGTPTPPPDLSDLRKHLTGVAARQRVAARHHDPLEALRAATPDVPPLVEPDPPPSTEETP